MASRSRDPWPSFSDNSYRRHLLQRLTEMQQNKEHTDVVLRAGDLAMPCHKLILAASSPYFQAMFASGMEETKSGIVELKDFEPETLTDIVNYIYTVTIRITGTNVQNLVHASDMLQLDSLKQGCEDFMIKQTEPSNCLASFKFARTYNLKSLRRHSHTKMLRNFKEVAQGSEFVLLNSEELIEFICDEDLEISNEDVVFDAVMKWVEYDLENRKDLMGHVMSHVRLPHCSKRHLCNIVSKHPLLAGDDECQKLISEAMVFQAHEEQQHEICSQRTIPRYKFGTQRQLLLLGGRTMRETSVNHCRHLRSGDDEFRKWERFTTLPMTDLEMFSACVVPSGVLITGGGRKGAAGTNCWLYGVHVMRWKQKGSLVIARSCHKAVVHGEQVYVLGGSDTYGDPIDSVEVCNVDTLQWSLTSPLPKMLTYPMAVTNHQHIYVLGGMLSEDHAPNSDSTSVFAFDPVWGKWHQKKDMPQKCRYGEAVSYNDMIFVMGGTSSVCMSYLTLTDSWIILSSPIVTHYFTSAVVWKGRILLGGGKDDYSNGVQGASRTSLIEEYDPETNTWTPWHTTLDEDMSCHQLLNMRKFIL